MFGLYKKANGIIFFLLLSGFVAAQTISPGDCYNETITVGVNESYDGFFLVCAEDCPDCPVCHPRCVYAEELKPGQIVNKLTDSCDLDITVESCKDYECEETTYNCKEYPTQYKETYKIQYDGFNDWVEISFAGRDYRYSLGNDSNFDITNTLTFDCPTTIDEKEDPDDILARCKAVVPTYCTDFTKMLMEKFDACDIRENICKEELKTMQDMKSNSVCVESKYYAELIASGNICQNETKDCSFENGILEREKFDLNDTKNGLIFLNIISWGMVAIFKVRYDKVKPKNQTGLI